MFLLKTTREALVGLLPPGGVGLEIGVAEGTFTQVLLDQARPSRLHLIDPWEHQSGAAYGADTNNVPAEEAERRYRAVTQRFSGAIGNGQVVVHRGYSGDLASGFPDNYFDWIYIDGAHYFEACAEDLRLYRRTVKSDGLILGHDYAASPAARAMNFQVVEAVNAFVAAGQAEFLLLTSEQFPTYVLAKPPLQARPLAFVGQALAVFDVAAEIRRPEAKRFEQYIATISDGQSTIAERLVLAFD